MPPRLWSVLRALLVVFLIFAGAMHFVIPKFYEQIVPPPLPAGPVVILSGLAEIALGALLAVERSRRLAAWGAVALLIAVFPANLYMAISNVQLTDLPAWMEQPTSAARWGRLPVQLVFLAWAWLFTRRDPPRAAA